jgi:hypothetical protein
MAIRSRRHERCGEVRRRAAGGGRGAAITRRWALPLVPPSDDRAELPVGRAQPVEDPRMRQAEHHADRRAPEQPRASSSA